jgi:hypothetical protein
MYKTIISRKSKDNGTQAVYICKGDIKIFAFWYDSSVDNPLGLTPRDAVYRMISNAGYDDLADFFNCKAKKMG